jgi:hypothetical protein
MDCPACGSRALAFTVPKSYRSLLPGSDPGVALCTVCVTLQPVADPPAGEPDFTAVSDAFPSEYDAAVPMALLVGLLDSLALYRTEIQELLVAVERAGTDPLLVLDRLAGADALDPAFDVSRRRHQLEQLL